MSRLEYLELMAGVKKERKKWPPAVKVILAFILGLLLLSPAILRIYWNMFLSK